MEESIANALEILKQAMELGIAFETCEMRQ
jgi:hypothetical protein